MKYLYLFLLAGLLCPVFCFSQTVKPIADTASARFFISAGINSSSTKVSGADQLSKANASTSMFPEIGAGAEIFFNKKVRNLIFKPSLSFTETKGDFSLDGNTGTPYTINYNYKQAIIALNLEVAYNIVNQQNLKFYVAAGGAVDYGLYSGTNHTITYHVNSTTNSESALDPITVSNVFFNATARIGVELSNRFGLYAAYIPSYSFTNYATLAISTTSFRAGVSYLF